MLSAQRDSSQLSPALRLCREASTLLPLTSDRCEEEAVVVLLSDQSRIDSELGRGDRRAARLTKLCSITFTSSSIMALPAVLLLLLHLLLSSEGSLSPPRISFALSKSNAPSFFIGRFCFFFKGKKVYEIFGCFLVLLPKADFLSVGLIMITVM